jgi:hypothetical protein
VSIYQPAIDPLDQWLYAGRGICAILIRKLVVPSINSGAALLFVSSFIFVAPISFDGKDFIASIIAISAFGIIST